MTTFPYIFLLMSTALVFHADAAVIDSTVKPIAVPPGLLKPATPIAGTNILLNIPYKWHVNSMPGCFAAKLEDVRNVFVLCTKEYQQFYDTPDATWILERTEGSESVDEYHEAISIIHLGVRQPVIHFLPFSTVVSVYPDYIRNKWIVRPDPSDKNNIALEPKYFNSWVTLETMDEPHEYSLVMATGRAPVCQFAFVAEIKLEANMYNFVFTEPPSGAIEAATSKKDLIDSYEINNNSPASLTRVITVSEKITNEFAWGLSESLKAFAKVTAKVEIPFIASTAIEAGFEFDFSSNQNWKSSEEKTFEMSYTAEIPPYTIIKISAWYDLIKDISMNYTSETEITGKGTRMTIYDDVVEGLPATGEMIRKYLEYIKFDGTVVQIKANSVITRIKGTMVASVGLRGQLNVDGKSVMRETIPE